MDLQTDRLILRPFTNDDLGQFAQINADPKVMAYFPQTLSKTETQAVMQNIRRKWAKYGFGFAAMHLAKTGRMIGMCGLSCPEFDSDHPLANTVEIGWRLHPDFWGKGLVAEAARRWLTFGFDTLNLPKVIAFAPTVNTPSRRVMQRLGMAYVQGGDFNHRSMPDDHWLQPIALYGLLQKNWNRASSIDTVPVALH